MMQAHSVSNSEAPPPPKLALPLQQQPADKSMLGRRKNPFTDLLPKASSPTAPKAERAVPRVVMAAGMRLLFGLQMIFEV